eukprot:3346003-Alexandrium_andersonii.AAC.1
MQGHTRMSTSHASHVEGQRQEGSLGACAPWCSVGHEHVGPQSVPFAECLTRAPPSSSTASRSPTVRAWPAGVQGHP